MLTCLRMMCHDAILEKSELLYEEVPFTLNPEPKR